MTTLEETRVNAPIATNSQSSVQVPREPVFFMHIAKTAGSYFNEVLKSALGSELLKVHCEFSIGSSDDLRKALDRGVRVFSGHVMNPLWNEMAGPLRVSFRKVTLLRDPIDHLASHLLWLEHYTRANMRKHYRDLDRAHQIVADRLAAIDLTDVGQLDDYLTNLSGLELRLFDNCQARYFLMQGRRDVNSYKPLSLADAKALSRAIKDFDAIGFQDNLVRDVPRLGQAIGIDLEYVEKRVNTAGSTSRIDTTNPVVRQVLSKRTILDQWLWRHARQEQAASQDRP